jgi:hypothetical protein
MSDRVAAGKLVSLTYSIRDDAEQVHELSNLPLSYSQGGNSELIGGMDAAIAGKRLRVRIRIQDVREPSAADVQADAADDAPATNPGTLH